jgi:hypothetical protein
MSDCISDPEADSDEAKICYRSKIIEHLSLMHTRWLSRRECAGEISSKCA